MANNRKLGKPKAYGQLHLRLPLMDLYWLKDEAELYAQPIATVARRAIREARLRDQGTTQTGTVPGRSSQVSLGTAPTPIVAHAAAGVNGPRARGQRVYEPPVIRTALSIESLEQMKRAGR